MATKLETFEDIFTAAMNRVKLPLTDTEALEACKESINTRMDEVTFTRKWKWRSGFWQMIVDKKVTGGTVSISSRDRTVTGVGTDFKEKHKGWFFRSPISGHAYKVIGVDETAQELQLGSLYAGKSVVDGDYVLFNFEYGLPPDFNELDYVMVNRHRTPVNITSPEKLVKLYSRFPYYEGQAFAVTVDGHKTYCGPELDLFLLDHDYLVDEGDRNSKLSVFPVIPDEDYVLDIYYTREIPPLVNNDDVPYMNRNERPVLLYGATADLFFRERNEEMGQLFEAKFDRALAKMERNAKKTDDYPQFEVPGKWWRSRRDIHPASADLGKFFDTLYRNWD